MIEFRVDRRSGVPTYLQLVDQVRQALLLGRLEVGDRLPPAREVVGTTAINPNTVLKAYRELEHEGLVEGRVGSGTFITRTLARRELDVSSELGAALGRWAEQAQAVGLGRQEIEALVGAVLDRSFGRAHGSDRTSVDRGDGRSVATRQGRTTQGADMGTGS